MSEIKGYKVLTEDQKLAINDFKTYESDLLYVLKRLNNGEATYQVDKRWISIARTHLEQGFMAACRAIAIPETVEF